MNHKRVCCQTYCDSEARPPPWLRSPPLRPASAARCGLFLKFPPLICPPFWPAFAARSGSLAKLPLLAFCGWVIVVPPVGLWLENVSPLLLINFIYNVFKFLNRLSVISIMRQQSEPEKSLLHRVSFSLATTHGIYIRLKCRCIPCLFLYLALH